jgi:ribosome-associated protein
MIKISKNMFLNKRDIKETFIRSSGPGGQNVNKVATKVQIRLNVIDSLKPSNFFISRLKKIAGTRLKENGDIIINSSRYKSQIQNRKDAEKKLIYLLKDAMKLPQKRKPTAPSRASIEKRLREKRNKGFKKKDRKKIKLI